MDTVGNEPDNGCSTAEDSGVVRTIRLIGAPTDINSSFLRGPAKAPPVIRAALHSDMTPERRVAATAAGAMIDS